MKTTEVNKELIGKRCECIFTGLMVTGVIEDTEENEHTKEVKVRFDRPHQWGDDLYPVTPAAALCQRFGYRAEKSHIGMAVIVLVKCLSLKCAQTAFDKLFLSRCLGNAYPVFVK